jgi:phosphoserine phosphatase
MPDVPFEAVILDCDSTLSSIEGVDELARRRGVGPEIAALTEQAMQGRVPLEDVYGKRLELIRPDRDLVRWLGDRYVETLVPGADELVRVLRDRGKDVHVVSGGILQAVLVLATRLHIPPANVHAVELRFGDGGRFAGYARESPLARAGGKGTIARGIARGRRFAAVGDGVTDLEMQEAGATLIGFGGVAVREAVRERADVWVGESSLATLLPHLLTERERRPPGTPG